MPSVTRDHVYLVMADRVDDHSFIYSGDRYLFVHLLLA
jgi:hypothetical protein